MVSLAGGRIQVMLRRRTVPLILALVALVVGLALLGTALGTVALAPAEVLSGLLGSASRTVTLTVQQFRLPRTVVAVEAGMALGLAGSLTQAVTRNPLASPDVLGVTSGASAGAVAVLLAAGGAYVGYAGPAAELSRLGVPLGALAGALLSAALVLTLSARRIGGIPEMQRVVLVGILANAVFLALVQWGLTVGDVDQAAKAAVYLTGSLNGRGWEQTLALTASLAVLLPAALAFRRPLDVLALGEEAAVTLGVSLRRVRLALFAVAFSLVGVAVAAVGPVSYVALLAPQVARRLTGTAGTALLAPALVGAALLLAADLVARFVIPGTELPAGAVTALVGAPLLLALVLRPVAR
ncbi:MAG: FecCD family ABC transporter permease [Actinomycetota bacterium]